MPRSRLETRVSQLLRRYFGGSTIMENYRPEWMMLPDGTRLELDFYIENLGIAIEVQGLQHAKFIRFFHGDMDGFKLQQERDQAKHILCGSIGIELLLVWDEDDCIRIIERYTKSSDTVELYQSALPPYPQWLDKALELFKRGCRGTNGKGRPKFTAKRLSYLMKGLKILHEHKDELDDRLVMSQRDTALIEKSLRRIEVSANPATKQLKKGWKSAMEKEGIL